MENDANASAWAEAQVRRRARVPRNDAGRPGHQHQRRHLDRRRALPRPLGVGRARAFRWCPTGGCAAAGTRAARSGAAAGTRWWPRRASSPGALPKVLSCNCSWAGEGPSDVWPGDHQAATEGDPAALRSFQTIGGWLGQGLADLAAILDPASRDRRWRVQAGDLLLDPAPAAFERALTGRVIGARRDEGRPARRGRRIVGAADLARSAVRRGLLGRRFSERRPFDRGSPRPPPRRPRRQDRLAPVRRLVHPPARVWRTRSRTRPPRRRRRFPTPPSPPLWRRPVTRAANSAAQAPGDRVQPGSGGGAGGMKCSSSSSRPGPRWRCLARPDPARPRSVRGRSPIPPRSLDHVRFSASPAPLPVECPSHSLVVKSCTPSTPRVPRASSAPCRIPVSPRVSRVPRASPSPSPGAPGAFPSPCAPRVPVVPSSPLGPRVSEARDLPAFFLARSDPRPSALPPWARFRRGPKILRILQSRGPATFSRSGQGTGSVAFARSSNRATSSRHAASSSLSLLSVLSQSGTSPPMSRSKPASTMLPVVRCREGQSRSTGA